MRLPILSVSLSILSTLAHSQTLTDVASRRAGIPVEGNGTSTQVQISADERVLVFTSSANNLVAGDTNGVTDVFLRRFDRDTLEIASVSTSGVLGNGASERASYGQAYDRVVFESDASNLVAGDTNAVRDIFVRNTAQQSTVRISTGLNGEANLPSRKARISPSGIFAVFESDAWNLTPFDGNASPDVFSVSLNTPSPSVGLISWGPQGNPGNAGSFAPCVADNGAVAFESLASDLVPNDTNGKRDVFCTSANPRRVSISTSGVQANGDSWGACISTDGRYVAFVSDATNLVPGDTNGHADIFVRDLQFGTTSIESLTTMRLAANGASSQPTLDATGRYLAFRSSASNLADADTNAADDIFLRDRLTGFVRRVSLTFLGQQANGASEAPSISNSASLIAFHSLASNIDADDQNANSDAFVYDTRPNSTLRASMTIASGRVSGRQASLSADGRLVAFVSNDTNLVAGDTNGYSDVFLRDRETGDVTRVSLTTGGGQINGADSTQPFLTPDGRHVVFTSSGSVVGWMNASTSVYLHDRHTATTTLVSTPLTNGAVLYNCSFASASSDARFVVFSAVNQSSSTEQVYVRDRLTATTELISRQPVTGAPGSASSKFPRITPDGRFVVFESEATNLAPSVNGNSKSVYRFDRATSVMQMVLTGEYQFSNLYPCISNNGRHVAFMTSQSLLPEDTSMVDVYVKDMTLQSLTLASANLGGGSSVSGSVVYMPPQIRGDGSEVAFASTATDLVVGTQSSSARLFVRNLASGITRLESISNGGVPSNGSIYDFCWSADGTALAFTDYSTTLMPVTWTGPEVFVRDSTPALTLVYCAAKLNSAGCAPRIDGIGQPRLSGTAPYWVVADRVINQKNGLLFYGWNGNNVPFQGGTLCVAPPTTRTTLQNSGGLSGANDCTGTFQFDMNAWARSGADAQLVPGTDVHCQYWYRDPGLVGPNKTGLSDALRFTLQP